MPTRKRKYSTSAQQLAVSRPPYKKPRSKAPPYNITTELKFHDETLNVSPVSSTGVIPLSGSIVKIAQGTEENERIGRKCTIKSIHWRYQLQLPRISGNSLSEAVRVIMFWDKQANGATATPTDILESALWQSFNNLSNSGRFVTLMDRTHNINYLTMSVGGLAVENIQVLQDYDFHKKVNIPIEYSGVAGAVSELKSNNIGVLLVSRNDLVVFSSQTRVRYEG